MARRTGRGRLSSIELLPPEAGPIKAWAFAELRARERHQIDILAEFNDKLRALAKEIGRKIKPISLTAFNRQAFRTATTARAMEETRVVTATLAERLKPGETDDLTLIAGELIKTLVFTIVEAALASGDEDGGLDIDPKAVMELSRALQAAASAQKVSSDRRAKVQKDFDDKAEKAIDTVAKEKGLTEETVAAIKRKILGVKEAA